MTTRYATLAINTMMSNEELTSLLASSVACEEGAKMYYPKRDQKDVDFLISKGDASYTVRHGVSPRTGQTIIRIEDATEFNPNATADAFLLDMAAKTNGKVTSFVQDESLEGVRDLTPSDATEYEKVFDTASGMEFLKTHVSTEKFEALAASASRKANEHLSGYINDLLKKLGGNGSDTAEAEIVIKALAESVSGLIDGICARNETHARQNIPQEQLSEIKAVHAIKPEDYTP